MAVVAAGVFDTLLSFQSLSTPLDIALVLLALLAIAGVVRFVRRHAQRLEGEAERAFPDGS
jgi:hypothetical protein